MSVSKMSPEVSVVLALNKIDQYTDMAILSILNQVDVNFEFILVANGEQHRVVESTLSEQYGSLEFVQVLSTPIPQLTYALNLAVSYANADYIARMDADDVSVTNRLRIQLDYMSKNSLDVLGSDIILIDEDGVELGNRSYPCGMDISKLLPFRNCFCHPTVLFKKEVFYKARGYNSGFNSEDYDFWLRLMRLGVRWDNINKPLLSYRVHKSSAQGTRLAYAECAALAVREFFIKKNLSSFIAIFVHVIKFLYKPMR